jgi:inosine/xanthosine triphosphate pyrophosphatase family protein
MPFTGKRCEAEEIATEVEREDGLFCPVTIKRTGQPSKRSKHPTVRDSVGAVVVALGPYGGTFTKGWSDDDADLEAMQAQGVVAGAAGTALSAMTVTANSWQRLIKQRNERAN